MPLNRQQETIKINLKKKTEKHNNRPDDKPFKGHYLISQL